MPNDYLFTWTPKGWPYANLRALVDDFEAGKKVTEPWRCMAHKTAKPGDTAYFLKLGNHPQGIFGVGAITARATKNSAALPGQNAWQIPIVFQQLVDPTRKLLVSEKQLAAISVPSHTWHPQGSGVRLVQEAARKIDEIIGSAAEKFLSADAADIDDFDALNIKDARERINRSIAVRRGQQAFRSKLLAAYDRKCAITGCDIEDLLEAAHIVPYRGPQTNHVQNGLLLRSDIHTLFDCGLIAIDPASKKIILSSRLTRSSYRSLVGRKIRATQQLDQAPSNEAITKHLLSTGL
jgi:putative restriction endonuclease